MATIKITIAEVETHEPIVGAAVTITGTSNGTISDANGVATLSANVGDEFTITYIGYATYNGVITSTNMEVILLPDGYEMNVSPIYSIDLQRIPTYQLNCTLEVYKLVIHAEIDIHTIPKLKFIEGVRNFVDDLKSAKKLVDNKVPCWALFDKTTYNFDNICDWIDCGNQCLIYATSTVN